MNTHSRAISVCLFLSASLLAGCSTDSVTGGADSGTAGTCDAAVERWVTIGRWSNASCTGTMVASQRLPVHYGSTCCHSSTTGAGHENSSSRFTCGASTFTYTQWTSLTCSGGTNPAGVVKAYTLTDCTEDTPPGTWGRITDFSGCM